jgi:hypothetical protein
MPRMLSDIIENVVTSQPDMELADGNVGLDLESAVTKCRADAVIVAETYEGNPYAILLDHPRLKLLVVSRAGEEARLVEFRVVPIAEVSPNGLINAIRAATVLPDA